MLCFSATSGYFSRNRKLNGDEAIDGECGDDFFLNLIGVTCPALLELKSTLLPTLLLVHRSTNFSFNFKIVLLLRLP